MAFTRNWDETFPPDTQPANLLGQDLRNLKEDVRERVAALGGAFASRPAVGDMVTAWGAYGGNGVMYFATDTGDIYTWNGAAWVDVTTAFVPARVILASGSTLYNATDPSYFGATQEVVEFSVTITTHGGNVLVTCNLPAFMSDPGAVCNFYLGIDHAVPAQLLAKHFQSSVLTFPNIIMQLLVTGVAAGAHTFNVFVETTGIDPITIPANSISPAVLTAVEQDF